MWVRHHEMWVQLSAYKMVSWDLINHKNILRETILWCPVGRNYYIFGFAENMLWVLDARTRTFPITAFA